MTTPTPPAAEDRYLSIDELAGYSGLSARTLWRYIAADPPLPHFKLGARILVKRSEFDAWLARVGTPNRVARARTHDEQVQDAVRGVLGFSRSTR